MYPSLMDMRVPMISCVGTRAREYEGGREHNRGCSRAHARATVYGVWGGMESLIRFGGGFLSIFLWCYVFPN